MPRSRRAKNIYKFSVHRPQGMLQLHLASTPCAAVQGSLFGRGKMGLAL